MNNIKNHAPLGLNHGFNNKFFLFISAMVSIYANNKIFPISILSNLDIIFLFFLIFELRLKIGMFYVIILFGLKDCYIDHIIFTSSLSILIATFFIDMRFEKINAIFNKKYNILFTLFLIMFYAISNMIGVLNNTLIYSVKDVFTLIIYTLFLKTIIFDQIVKKLVYRRYR
jgi:hypothetical protein